MRESAIEKKVCDRARKLGYYVRKFVSPQQRGVPDRLFISPGGKVFFIEFKAPGKKPTPLQEYERSLIQANNICVYVVDNAPAGMWLVDTVMRHSWMPSQTEVDDLS